ncbi:hypothetical protein [Virgibacillus kimchii]
MHYYLSEKRTIDEIETPLLVPSFSSKGIRNIGDIHYYLRDYLVDTSLISAYDLYYGFIQHENIFETDVLFIDSGGYERDQEHDLSEIYNKKYIPRVWSLENYRKEINKIEPITDLVLVNYDFRESMSLEEQTKLARNDFKKYPNFISDFLCKPVAEGQCIDIDNLIDHVHLLSDFDILGLTEKELGRSVLDRCVKIYKLRLALNKANISMPIHIFGCLDPLNIIIYFLSGADIFDGLSWLRFGFYGNTPIYLNSHVISSGKWDMEDIETRFLVYSENLQQLSNLKKKMIQFIEKKDINAFGLGERSLVEISALMEQVYEITSKEDN